MRKYQKGPSVNILSFRVNDHEKAMLERISSETKLSISDLLRKTLLEFQAEYRRSQLREIEECLVQRALQQPAPEFYRYGRCVVDDYRAPQLEEGPLTAAGSEA